MQHGAKIKTTEAVLEHLCMAAGVLIDRRLKKKSFSDAGRNLDFYLRKNARHDLSFWLCVGTTKSMCDRVIEDCEVEQCCNK